MKHIDHESLFYNHALLTTVAFGCATVLGIASIILICTGHITLAIWLGAAAVFCAFACRIEGKQADYHHTQWLRELGGWEDSQHEFVD